MKNFLRSLFYAESKSELNTLFFALFFSAILSLFPLFYTWGKLNIGGDVLIPLNASGLEKYLYHWTAIGDGKYYVLNYYPYYLIYKAFEFFNLSIYQISSVLFFILSVIAGIGIYKICTIFHESKNPFVYFTPIAFYLFSPALLNAWHYNFIYSFLPLFIYFIFKSVKNNKINIVDVIWVSAILFFCSMDLPNPKYIFYLHLNALLIFLGALAFRLIDVSFFKINRKELTICILMNSYILIPNAYFVTQYSAENYGVNVKAEYKNTGPMPDYRTATIDTMLKLHNANVFLNNNDASKYKKNVIASFFSYFFISIIMLVPLISKNKLAYEKKYLSILFGLLLVYIFLSVGPNPPFGFIYEYLVSTFPLLAFLRTTAGAVFFLSLFYAILLYVFIEKLTQHKIKITLLILFVLSIVSYPFLNGDYYKNFNGNHYADTNQRGFKVPDAYFRVKDTLDSLKLVAKIYYPNSDLTYLNTKWGFFGPVIYNFIYKNSNIGFNNVNKDPTIHNVGFIYQDNSLFGQDGKAFIKSSQIINESFITISRTDREDFLPLFFGPTKLLSSREADKAWEKCESSRCIPLRSVVLDSETLAINAASLNLMNNTHLEFRRINATKYRVRIHGVGNSFLLAFSENYNSGWKIYSSKMWNVGEINASLINYKIFDGNKEDQASVYELKDYLQQGYITTLGDGEAKIFEHKKWENYREVPSYNEEFRTEFISKNFQGTIQNDNLPSGPFYETWLKKSLPEKNHLMVNRYANGWLIDVAHLCANQSQACLRNNDGSFETEIVVEFWPQQIYIIAIAISGLTLFFSFAGWLWFRRKR
jgi:hypothetical protein